jgi:hypothetical protein
MNCSWVMGRSAHQRNEFDCHDGVPFTHHYSITSAPPWGGVELSTDLPALQAMRTTARRSAIGVLTRLITAGD